MGSEPLAFENVVAILASWCERTVKVFVDARPSGRLMVRLLGRLGLEGEDIPEAERANGRVFAFNVGDDRLLLYESAFDEAMWVSDEREFLMIYDSDVCLGVIAGRAVIGPAMGSRPDPAPVGSQPVP